MGASAPLDCPGGTYSNALGQSSVSTCVTCPAGSFCVTGATGPLPCSAGTVSLEGVASCTKCVAGTHQEREGSTGCKRCPAGSYCAEGASTPVPCEGGTYGPAAGLSRSTQCLPVKTGFWAPIGSKAPEECFPGFYCPGALTDVAHRGSKPIILESGAAAVGSTVFVASSEMHEAVSTELTLDATMDAFNETAMRLELAELYNVPPEYITLDVSAGSVVVSVVVVQPTSLTSANTSAASAGLVSLMDASAISVSQHALSYRVTHVIPLPRIAFCVLAGRPRRGCKRLGTGRSIECDKDDRD